MCLTSCSLSCSEAISTSSGLDASHLELAELAAAKRGAPPVALAGGLELVDEAAKRRPVAQREPEHVEGQAGDRPDLGRPGCPGNLLPHAHERRQRAADTLHLPDPVELGHSD